MLSTKQKS